MATPSTGVGRGVLAVLLAAVLFGTTGTAQTFAPAGAEPLSVGAARLVLGGAVLGLIGLAGHLARRRTGAAARPLTVAAAVWVGVAAVGMTAYQATFFAGTRANGVAVGTVVALGSSPLFTGLLEWLLFRRRPTARWAVATGLAVLGVLLLANLFGAAEVRAEPAGLAASLGAGVAYAAYAVATKALLERGWGSVAAVAAVFAVAAVLSVPLLAATDTSWLTESAGVAVTAWLGIAVTVVPYLLLGFGLKRLPAATVTTLTLAEPATAAGLGVLVLAEPLTPLQVLGIAAVATGVLLVGTTPRR